MDPLTSSFMMIYSFRSVAVCASPRPRLFILYHGVAVRLQLASPFRYAICQCGRRVYEKFRLPKSALDAAEKMGES